MATELKLVSSKTGSSYNDAVQRDRDAFSRIFQQFRKGKDETKPIGENFVATKVWLVQRKHYNDDNRRLASKLTTTYKPSGSDTEVSQRTAFECVDNVCYVCDRGSNKIKIVLGRFNKQRKVFGENVQIDGLVVAAGGHVEINGDKSNLKNYPAKKAEKVKVEPGDVSLLEAANKELKEEIGIDRNHIVGTYYLGLIKDCLNDTTVDCIRHVFLRFISKAPKESEELADVYAVPIEKLDDLLDGTRKIESPKDGKELSFVKGHDTLLKIVQRLDGNGDFLATIQQMCQEWSEGEEGVKRQKKDEDF